jgi:acetyltransferase-like isoleucine patch superfamily enzyme
MLNRYSFLTILKLFFSFLNTKLFYGNSRLIRLPFDVRNKSNIDFGIGLTTGVGCRIEAFPSKKDEIVLKFGKNVQINDYVHITASECVKIGNNVLFASKIYISDCSHGSYSGDNNDSHPNTSPSERKLFSKPVHIEDNVWLGEFVSVLPGVTIGKGTIVGANSVVSKSLPSNVIAVGIPAKPIKKFNFESSRWEKYSI